MGGKEGGGWRVGGEGVTTPASEQNVEMDE